MPLLYTGQETGMNRAFEFFKKDTAPEFEPRNEFFTFYQKLNALKHTQPALKAGVEGGEIVRYATESDNLYIFSRCIDEKPVIVMVNLGKDDSDVKYTAEAPKACNCLINYFTGEAEEFPATLSAGEYKVFVKK